LSISQALIEPPLIAEGVETVAQLSFLATERCAGIQGFLIGRPQPIAHDQSVVSAIGGGAIAMKRAS
jgi:EAL domain-containing protein (putative c-di-GMP-specific phosphodiesterase class I)